MLTPIQYRLNRMRRLTKRIRERSAVRLDLPRLAYIGALGQQNLGDEAMFAAAQRCYAGHTLISLEMPYIENALARLGLSGPTYFKGVILGGGTLVSPFWTPWVRLGAQWRLPIWTLGTGAGSSGYDDDLVVDLQEWRELLPRFHAVGLRGPRSLKTIQALNCLGAEVIGDLALILAPDRPPPPTAPRRFLVNLALPNGTAYAPEKHLWQREMETVIARLAQQGWEPVGAAMHPRDAAPTERLLRRAVARPAPVSRPETAEEFFALTSSCRFAITVRLHAAVLACCVGVPPLMIGYRDKCLDFMESLDITDWYVDQQQMLPGEIDARAETLAGCCLEMRDKTFSAVQQLRCDIERYVRNTRINLLTADDLP